MPKLIQQKWQQGNGDMLKFIGFDDHHITEEVCLYLPNMRTLSSAISDPHHLLQCLQLCQSTQATTKELEANLDNTKETFMTNRSYCAGVKVCGDGKLHVLTD